MKKRMIIMIIALVVVFGGIFSFDAFRGYMIKQYFAHFEPPPAVISAHPAESKTWTPYLTTVGTLIAINGVSISSEASGLVAELNFKSGQIVTQGQLLVKLDDSVDQADLKNNQAALTLAQLNFDRIKNLFGKGAASSSDLDTNRAKLQQAQAAVDRTNALIAQKNIRAPFAGKIGIRSVNLGEYVTPGATILASLQSLDPLFIHFSLPEQDLKLLSENQDVLLKVQAYPDIKFQGKITAINSTVDPKSHTIQVQATVPNKDLKLYPGLFADIEVALPQQQNVITVANTAVAYSLYGDSVFVAKTEGKDKEGKPILKAYRTFVKTGIQRGNEIAIIDGVKVGDMVIDSGQLKLQNGIGVIINNKVSVLDNNTNVPLPNK